MKNTARWICLLGLERWVVTEKGRAIGTDLFVVIAHVDENMRMIERNGSARAHEFLDTDFDHRVTVIVLEVRNSVMTGHADLQMLYVD